MLRRPPRPPLPPSAHDVLREWRILDAIKGTQARSPRTLLACADESVIGAPFYVMEYVVGSVITERDPRAAGHTGGAAPDGPRPRECPGRGARGRLAGGRARGLRQADRLSGAPAEAVHRPVGVQQDARAPARAGDARLARGQHARVARGDDRARRLPAWQHDGRRRRAGAADRDLRLGAVHDRRPACRPRLPHGHLGPARRSRGHDVQVAVRGHVAATGFPAATS